MTGTAFSRIVLSFLWPWWVCSVSTSHWSKESFDQMSVDSQNNHPATSLPNSVLHSRMTLCPIRALNQTTSDLADEYQIASDSDRVRFVNCAEYFSFVQNIQQYFNIQQYLTFLKFWKFFENFNKFHQNITRHFDRGMVMASNLPPNATKGSVMELRPLSRYLPRKFLPWQSQPPLQKTRCLPDMAALGSSTSSHRPSWHNQNIHSVLICCHSLLLWAWLPCCVWCTSCDLHFLGPISFCCFLKCFNAAVDRWISGAGESICSTSMQVTSWFCVHFGVAWSYWLPFQLTQDRIRMHQFHCRSLDSRRFPLLIHFAHRQDFVWFYVLLSLLLFAQRLPSHDAFCVVF